MLKVRGYVFYILFLPFILSTGCSNQNVYTQENCSNAFIPCVNASVGKQKVKLLNGTSSLKVGGQHSETHVDLDTLDRQAKILKASKQDVVTLEFINKTPLSLEVYNDKYRESETLLNKYSFTLPDASGIYIYDILAEYSNGGVVHYLKVEVK